MVGKVLKDLRAKHGYTQQYVADHLKITRAAYANYEIGKREPDTETIRNLASFFGVSTDHILNNDKKDPQPSLKAQDEVDISDLSFAFHGGDDSLTEDDKRTIMNFVRFMRKQREEENKQTED